MDRRLDSLLLLRAGLLTVRGRTSDARVPQLWLRALDLELAALGHVLSHRARAALGHLDDASLAETHTWLTTTLGGAMGATERHEPLFRRFPHGVPEDTGALWLQKFLGFHFQRPGQPCLWCAGVGTTHVLEPCHHVVCDQCFDGSNYSACPVCERAVDREHPFFQPAPARGETTTPVVLRKIDLVGEDAVAALFRSLCARTQAMSPDDVAALVAVVQVSGEACLAWLPERIPVRENVAHVFGTLLGQLDAARVLAAGAPHLRSATDLLRVLAVWSGAEAALQPTYKRVRPLAAEVRRWSGRPRLYATEGEGALSPHLVAHFRAYPQYREYLLQVVIAVRRFKVKRMPRGMRRAVLTWLDGRPEESLLEEVARHRSAWVGVGEVLHPGEYATRFPTAKKAFDVARGKLRGVSFAARVEAARGDTAALAQLLRTRPGELWRRADAELRRASDPEPLLRALGDTIDKPALPLLLTLHTHLALRSAPWPVRVYFPKGDQFLAPSAKDRRPALAPEVIARVGALVEAELLARFARLPRVRAAVIDAAIADVVVPFNERTAARTLVSLPRGSSIALPDGERLRLFLHWCEPPGGHSTDIDLSVGLYDEAWAPSGVCSYYQLNLAPIAVHSGDRRDAPPPEGSSEFVDLDRAAARAAGHRYAVMVVNAYSGLPFSQLARAYAGVMRRTDDAGPVFDARSVELKFDLAGGNGTYAPLLVDLVAGRMWWLDVSSKGGLALNNVESSNAALTRIGPALLGYFGLGARPSMFELATLHAVARADTIWVRGAHVGRYQRRPGEADSELLARVRAGEDDGRVDAPALSGPSFAALYEGDLPLPEGSTAWALFRRDLTGTLAASDLLVVP